MRRAAHWSSRNPQEQMSSVLKIRASRKIAFMLLSDHQQFVVAGDSKVPMARSVMQITDNGAESCFLRITIYAKCVMTGYGHDGLSGGIQ